MVAALRHGPPTMDHMCLIQVPGVDAGWPLDRTGVPHRAAPLPGLGSPCLLSIPQPGRLAARQRFCLVLGPMLQASQHKQCRVKVTVLDETSSPDKGRKVKLVGMMVVEGGFSLDAMGVQLDLFANRGDKDLRMSEG